MNKENIIKLTKEAEKIPQLEYSNNLLEFRDNVKKTIKAVKRRLGVLQELESEIDYKLTLAHIKEDEGIGEDFINEGAYD